MSTLCVSHERVEKEMARNHSKYYGNKIEARNALVKKELEEKWFFINARAEYAKITCDKILSFFGTWCFPGQKVAKISHSANEV